MKKTAPKKSPSVGKDVLNSTIIVTSLLALPVIGFAIWMQIQATLHWQSGMEYGFIVLYPFVLLASLTLLINGIILLVRAGRRHSLKNSYRAALAVIGIIFLFPAGYLAQGFIAMGLTSYNASRVRSDEEITKMVQNCEIKSLRRDYESWDVPAVQRKSNAVAYLKNPNMSQADSYFYGHRTFNPSYYDELAKIASSKDVASRCGMIELYDEHRENIPTSYNWLTVAEAKASLDACQISNLITIEKPSETLTEKAAGAQNKSVGVFLALDPISEGYSGKLYITDANQQDRNTLLEFAKSKKGSCRYKQPNIDGKE